MKNSKLIRTNNFNNLCFICLNPTLTHLKLKCSCVVHIHIKCLTNYNINKCLICNRNFEQYEIYDFFGFDKIADNINNIMYLFGLDVIGENIINKLFNNYTIFNLLIFLIYCSIFICVIIFASVFELVMVLKKIILFQE